jgi:3-oxoacyl-(acyl-carrier-protein) synthase
MIRTGELDVVVVGATEAPLQESILKQYQSTGILSQSPIPSEALAPFDQDRTGTVLGEGAAFLILESEASVTRRGAQMLGRLEAVSIGTQSRYRGGLDREGLSLEKILHRSLEEARLLPRDLSLLHLHGTGTRLNDLLESQVVASVFGKISDQPYACATKGITGHTLGAASLFQVLLTLCALRENRIPKTTNCSNPDPACPLHYPTTTQVSHSLSTGLCLTSGFWGNVASVVVSKNGYC